MKNRSFSANMGFARELIKAGGKSLLDYAVGTMCVREYLRVKFGCVGVGDWFLKKLRKRRYSIWKEAKRIFDNKEKEL